jgi:uncharacterized protein YggE
MADDAFVEVTGHGSATTTPDRARIHVAAVARALAVGDAFAAADSALKAMLAAARDDGVADEDLRSTRIDVRAGRRGRGKGPGFRVSMGIEVTVHDVAAAGRLMAAIVEAGGDASRVERISLAAATPEEALAEARTEAWTNALGKARQYARLAGRDLGAVLRVSDGPQAHRYAGEASAFAADMSPVSVELGSQTVTAAVTVRWALL